MKLLRKVAQFVQDLKTTNVIEPSDHVTFRIPETGAATIRISYTCPDPISDAVRRSETIKLAMFEYFSEYDMDSLIADEHGVRCSFYQKK